MKIRFGLRVTRGRYEALRRLNINMYVHPLRRWARGARKYRIGLHANPFDLV